MNWLRFASGVFGAACVVTSILLPPAASVLMPVGTGFIGWAITPPGSTTAPKVK